jgi:hypothetical protein
MNVTQFTLGGAYRRLAVAAMGHVPRFPAPGGFPRRLLLAALFTYAASVLAVVGIFTVAKLTKAAAYDLDGVEIREDFSDFLPIYLHAERIRASEPLYWAWPDYGPHVLTAAQPEYPAERMPYPPFLSAALSYVSGVGLGPTAVLWHTLVFSSVFVYGWCLARLAGRSDMIAVGFSVAVVLSMPHTFAALSYGNVEPILWAMFGLALLSPKARGAGFSAITMIKLYGAWPLLFALHREFRRIVTSASIMIAVGAGLAALALGSIGVMEGFKDWVRYMLPVVGQGTFHPSNVSISFATVRVSLLLGLWEYTPGPLPIPARVYLSVVAIAVPVTVGWWARRLQPPMQYSLVTCAAVLFSPLCWATYLPLLLAPAAIGLRTRFEGVARSDDSVVRRAATGISGVGSRDSS